MHAVVIDHYGGNEVIQVRDVPVPIAGPSDVLVAVRAASMNPLDWKVRAGMVRLFTGSRFPKVLGSEGAGVVEAVGRSVSWVRPGDAVIFLAGARRLGAFAEFACADASTIYPRPAGLSDEAAACIPIAGLTALQALRDHGRLRQRAKVLINGASGGVGHLAIQVARELGAARVTGVCSGKNVDFVRGLGADRVVDYLREDFAKGDERYDVIFDAVSTRSFRECRRVIAPRGVYVSTLPNRTVIDQVITTLLPGKKARSMWVKPRAADIAWMAERIVSGRITVAIERTFSLEAAKEAFELSESGRIRGKVVFRIG